MSGRERLCLDLFAGVGGFSEAFEEADGWEVVTVDVEEKFDPDICADVLDLRPEDLPDADVVLVGHPCTLFSTAGNHDEWDLKNRRPTGDRAKRHVAMLFHTLGLVHAISPEYWYLENPRRSRINWLIGPPTEWVTYCQYGTDYQKPTGLWGDHAPGMTYRRCKRGDPCHTSNTENDGTCAIASMDRSDHAARSKVPYELSKAILDAVEGRLDQTQMTLITTDGGGKSPPLHTGNEQ